MSSLIDKVLGKGEHAADVQEGTGTVQEAPVTRERVHHDVEHADKTQKEDVHVKTGVETVVQPVTDQQREATDTRIVDEGCQMREEGFGNVDNAARDEMARRHHDAAQTAGTTTDTTTREVDERPDVDQSEKHRTIRQVQPVIERDVEVPHRVEHHKTDTKVVHEAPDFKETKVAPAMTVGEFQNASAGAGGASRDSD